MKPSLAKKTSQPVPAPGASETLDSLCREHLQKVKRWARRLAGPSADLEDLVHDILLVALRKGFKHRGEASMDTWLFRITQHVVWRRLRKNRIRQWLLGRNQAELAPPDAESPQLDLERLERRARLYRALDRLPEAFRTTLILYELEGLTGEEVARLTGVPQSTVWVRLHRARERLQRILIREEAT